MIYRCSFERIGRNHDVPPQEFVARDAQELAETMYSFVRCFLASSEVELFIDLDQRIGQVVVGGFRPAGTFAISEVGT